MMKIENVSMEFVSFDAQDVIATSGGPFAGVTKVKFTGALAKEYNQNHTGFDFGQTTGQIIADTTKTFGYDSTTMSVGIPGNYWKSYNSGNPSDAQLLTKITEIEDWLKANGYIQ